MKFISITLTAVLLFAVAMPLMAQDKDPVREDIEWIDAYMPNTNNHSLPRILLIGNSISRGYYPEVVKLLDGKAYVARLSTSKSICDPALNKEIALIMSYYKFDIVHFNNGLHGFGYTEEEYKKAFPGFVKAIRKGAPKARLIWATTTPMRSAADANILDPKTGRVKERNKIALDYIATQKDIKVDDLWTLAIEHPEYYQGGDGTHPIPSGFSALAHKVAGELSILLDTQK
ncbi:SGNH/GDSL hydrolase family protein [Mucilaginibacter sp. UR6-11]|uniref:SGNH/GDSL hydrolase family protein n=1 Tax=Mucilaginibacter sp. UR6-11 TaxID=1435644 RepID=UPI001E30DB64|nr:SGNH/GDSL hydrolase family protein [Mucilaginibacter sp. UR6-11]MCC8423725.1 SGNH/GDSL hydrolase family protein [Mucilaginibacter sp. UR6-11]